MRRILAMTLISMTMTGPVWACGMLMPSDMNLEDLMVEIDEPMELGELADEVVLPERPEGQPAAQALIIPQS